jgi:hypothetical protein
MGKAVCLDLILKLIGSEIPTLEETARRGFYKRFVRRYKTLGEVLITLAE